MGRDAGPGTDLSDSLKPSYSASCSVYYSTCILLFGAEFTQVYAKVRGGGIVPDENVGVVGDAEYPTDQDSPEPVGS